MTLGPGYDMKDRKAAAVKADLIAIGVDAVTATSASKGATLTASEAETFCDGYPPQSGNLLASVRHLLTSPLMRKLLPTLSMHRCQHICRWLAMTLAAVGVWSLPMPAQSAQLLQGYAGQWQVRRVLLNEERMDRLLYQVDDPRLVGRTVSIEPVHIESDLPEASTCTQPVLEPHLQPLNVLLTDTLVSTRPGQDLARAFGLSLPGTQEVKVAWTACTTGRFGPSLKGMPASRQTKSGRTWVALAAPNQLLLRWYGDTVLVLEPVPSEQQPRPSFACDRARLPAEQAICASPRLASYDLSVFEAWKWLVQTCEGEASCLNEARRTQRQWMLTRNRCGGDEACLRRAMKSRLDVLMMPAAD